MHNWHVEAIAEYLAAAASGTLPRLIINLPPRMLKSTLVSVAWPAWILGHNPSQRILAASYAQSLATRHSLDCRMVIASEWYRRIFPDTALSPEQNEKDRFNTTRRGHRLAVSVGGAAVGEGGNILIVDDPLNPLQASYATQRDAANAWFDHTFASRLDNKKEGSIVVVMQRLHPEDLSGYLLQKGGWEHLCLPAIAPARHTISYGAFSYTRSEGEALHPVREDEYLLERTRQEMGSANFAAQYQQSPQMMADMLVKPWWFKRFAGNELGIDFSEAGELAPASQGRRIVQSWDTAVKVGDGRDASACATFLECEGTHYLIDMLVAQLEYPDLKRAIRSQSVRFQPEVILLEDKSSGQSLLQDLRRETNLPLVAYMPRGDKVHRLTRVTPLLEAGKLGLPRHAAWLASLEDELFSFPQGKHDDQVDAISQYLNWLRDTASKGTPRMRRV